MRSGTDGSPGAEEPGTCPSRRTASCVLLVGSGSSIHHEHGGAPHPARTEAVQRVAGALERIRLDLRPDRDPPRKPHEALARRAGEAGDPAHPALAPPALVREAPDVAHMDARAHPRPA